MQVFGSLMWVDEDNHSSINNKSKRIESYFKQIDVLNKSLSQSQNVKLYVFSNNVSRIENWFKLKSKPLPNFISIAANYKVPHGTPFFGAHYKLEALALGRQLLRASTDRFILLDADVIALQEFEPWQVNELEKSDLIVYDISEQVFPAYGADRIRSDLELLIGEQPRPMRWYGGEFICASQRGLDRLLIETQKVLPTYFAHITRFHHVGDEMFVSAALNVIKNTPGDLSFVDQAPMKLVTRHWSRFLKPTIDQHMESAFLHLPGSKPVLEYLSIFGQPLNAPIRAMLKIYSLLVRLYQRFKHLRTAFTSK